MQNSPDPTAATKNCDRPGTDRDFGIWGKNTKNVVTLELTRRVAIIRPRANGVRVMVNTLL